MAKVITDNRHYADIAAAIRAKNETETLYKPSEMASAILAIEAGTSIPAFSYTGEYIVEIEPDTKNWKIKFLTSGDFVITNSLVIDAFLVGGGGAGGNSYSGGGGSGYTLTQKNVSLDAETYSILIGSGGAVGTDGGNTSAFGYTANGGQRGGVSSNRNGGNGGSGGGTYGQIVDGGSDGSDGGKASEGTAGKGQGTTTREFGESDGKLYAGGGAGGYYANGEYGAQPGKGGAGGGADPIRSAADNTGGGGGGGVHKGANGNLSGGEGGSGIVVIRNARTVNE